MNDEKAASLSVSLAGVDTSSDHVDRLASQTSNRWLNQRQLYPPLVGPNHHQKLCNCGQ
jgi:hypothetical protein